MKSDFNLTGCIAGTTINQGQMVVFNKLGLVEPANKDSFADVAGFYLGKKHGSPNILPAKEKDLITIEREAVFIPCKDAVSPASIGKTAFVWNANTVTFENTGTPAGQIVEIKGNQVAVLPSHNNRLYDDYLLYNDILGPATSASGLAALSIDPVVSGAVHATPFFRHDQDDSISWVFQLPHFYKPTTDLHFHLHALPAGTLAGNIRFSLRYWAGEIGTVVAAYANWNAINTTYQIELSDNGKNTLINGFIIPGTGLCESSIVICELTRLGTDPLDTYSSNKSWGTSQANLGILYGDIHYQGNKQGTHSHGCTG